MYRRIFFLLTITLLTLLIILTMAYAQEGTQPPPAPPLPGTGEGGRPHPLPLDAEFGPRPPQYLPEGAEWDPFRPLPPAPEPSEAVEIEPLVPSGIVRYVATTGTDSGDCTTAPCTTVQYAVDVSGDGDELRVAQGTYTDIHVRAGVTQTVYLSRSLILRGGYSADFSAWDPATYTTTLDAGGQGRVLYITDPIAPSVEGFSLTGGDATGLGGGLWGSDAGGGVYIITAELVISGCYIYSNTAGAGGGLYLWHSDATLSNNTVQSNTAGDGGGLYLSSSDATLSGNTVQSNTTHYAGGGLCLSSSDATLSGNTVHRHTHYAGGGLSLSGSDATLSGNTVQGNTAHRDGGGLFLSGSDATLSGNTVQGNTAYKGGGLSLYYDSDATLSGNTVQGNTAHWDGGGLYLYDSDATLSNDVIADNTAHEKGGGVYVAGASPRFLHTTLARNRGRSGVYVINGWNGNVSNARLVNTILVSHTVGIEVEDGNAAHLEGTLWGSGAWANGADWSGDVTTGTVNLWADPGFVNPAGGDYHLLPASAAVDAGADVVGDIDVEVWTDLDGDARPANLGYDMGADEIPGAALQPVKGSGQRGYNAGGTITYTIRLPNHGVAPALNVRLTDTLPATQRPLAVAASGGLGCAVGGGWGGAVVCSPTDIGVGETIYLTLTAEVTSTPVAPLPHPMRDHFQARGSNAAAAAALTVYLHDCHVQVNGLLPEYSAVQAAVDAAGTGDTVMIAGGLCVGAVEWGGRRQLAYISKTLTVRGGYSITNWTTPDPEAHPTVLDALGEGRVFYIMGGIAPLIEELGITGGDAVGLGGDLRGRDAGGGVYVVNVMATISNCRVYSNTADKGGGLYLWGSAATLSNNTVLSNAADYGGGLYLSSSDATLSGNTVQDNTADIGGGLYLSSSDATLSGNTVQDNTAPIGGGLCLYHSDATLSGNTVQDNTADTGGGLYLSSSDATLSGNTVQGNTAYMGGGLYLDFSDSTLSGNTVQGNTAHWDGGGLYLYDSDATLSNNFIADNTAHEEGGGVYVAGASPRFLHTTLARNRGGSGVYVTNGWNGNVSTAWLTDTILVSHTVGISVTAGNTATLEATLWGAGDWANGDDWGEAGHITTGTVNLWGDPAFVDPAHGDYHITAASAALDAGVDAGVTADIDGDPRPAGFGYDIGADEWMCYPFRIFLPLVLRNR